MQLLNKKAITVIEVILSISIGFLVMTLVYGFWHTVVKSDKSFKSATAFYRNVPLAINTMESDLMNAVSYDFSASYPDERAFKFNDKRIEFLVRLPDGINRVVYELGVPDLGSVKVSRIGRGVKDIEKVISSTTHNEQIFLLRGEVLLTDELVSNKKVKATQILLGPFAPGQVTWKVNSMTDKQLRESDRWDKSTLPQAVRVRIEQPQKLRQSTPIEAVLLLPQMNNE